MPGSGESRQLLKAIRRLARAVDIQSRRIDRELGLTLPQYIVLAAVGDLGNGTSREIAAAADGFTVVVTKSSVPVGTGDEVERIIRDVRPSADITVACFSTYAREAVPEPLDAFPALQARVARCEALPVFRRYYAPFFQPSATGAPAA